MELQGISGPQHEAPLLGPEYQTLERSVTVSSVGQPSRLSSGRDRRLLAPHVPLLSKWQLMKRGARNVFGAHIACEPAADGSGCCGRGWRCVVTDDVRMASWVLLGILSFIVLVLAIINVASGKITIARLTDHKHYAAVAIAGVFSFAATLITFIQVRAHHRHFTAPATQKKIVRIILMVPIYAWSAWFGLIFVQLAPYIDFIRVCYEAFVIFNFL